MTIPESLAAFVFAAGLLTITPGLDTALVLRASTFEGRRRGGEAAAGITLGCLGWGALVAVGLAALLQTSHLAFTALKWAGALYLLWMGGRMLFRPCATPPAAASPDPAITRGGWFLRGLACNLLNPKMGVFYVSFLPQFIPTGLAVGPYILLLATIHAVLGVMWYALIIVASRPLSRALQRPAVLKTLDRLTGLLFVGFGARLALAKAG